MLAAVSDGLLNKQASISYISFDRNLPWDCAIGCVTVVPAMASLGEHLSDAAGSKNYLVQERRARKQWQ